MSIILDSLKRAERERRVGDTPASDSLYAEKPTPAGPHKPKRRWLAGLLLVNLVVIAFLAVALFQKQPAPEGDAPAAQPAPLKAAESREAIQPAPSPADNAISASASMKEQSPDQPGPGTEKTLAVPSSPPPRKENTAQGEVRFGPPVAVTEDMVNTTVAIDPAAVPMNRTGKTVDQTATADAGLPAEQEILARVTPPATPEPALETEILSPPNDAQAPTPTNVDEEPQWVRVPQQRPAENAPPPVKRERVVVDTSPSPSFETNAEPASAAPALKRPTAPDPNDQAPLLQDLPPDIREKLKTVKISVLVYAEPQEACMVYINSRRYRPGDKVGVEGYLLERIVPDGIILDYGKGRVKIRSGR